jgi:DUF4097 and DUF4098 domain-containing protein YvlB
MGVPVALCGLALTAGLFAQPAPLKREGGYWVEVLEGAAVLAPAAPLVVQTRGAVVVRGGRGASEARYVLRKRVRARSEAEARKLLAAVALRTTASRLQLVYPASSTVAAELEVAVPARVRSVAVDTDSGDVAVTDIQGRVDVRSGAGAIQMDRIGSSVTARTAGGEIRLGRIGGGVRCYSGGGTITVESAGGESWFDTAGGEIHIGRSAGPIHASTAGGNIQVGQAGSSVAARTAGGRIDIAEANGAVIAGNSGGSIHVGAANGVRLEATGGSIRLRGSSGALRAVSDVGHILAELMSGSGLKDSLLSTASGDITVYLPSDIAVTIQALNESGRAGRIVSEFQEIPVRSARRQSNAMFVAEGSLNGGGPTLKLTSTDGTIYLRRVRQ